MPVRDRFEELQAQRKLLEKGETKPGRQASKKDMDGGKTMQAFLSDASKVKEELEKMKADVAAITKLQHDMLSTPFTDKKNVGKYESLSEKVRLDATKIGTSLKQLENKYSASDIPDSNAFKQIRTQQLNTLTTELNIATNNFFKVQAEYVDKMRARIRRQLDVTLNRGDTSNDDSKINLVLDKDFSVFTDNYISDVHDAEQTLRDLDDRKKDILALEKGVTEVNGLFKELNLLVSVQGEKLTTIESAVENTTAHVESGKVELEKAKEYRARARKRRCCIIMIVLIILVVIGIVITISVVASK